MAVRKDNYIKIGDNMEMLVRDKLVKQAEGTLIKGYVLISGYQLNPQKNGGFYISGTLQAMGTIPFKVWSSTVGDSLYAKMTGNESLFKGSICYVEGKVDRYGGNFSLVLNEGRVIDGEDVGLKESDFLEDVYDVGAFWQSLIGVLKKNCSEKAVTMFERVISEVKERFMTEFAAVWHHDNCKAGLLAHTTKVVRMASLIRMYPEIAKKISPDVLFIGCALHDIGKIYEYRMGAVSTEGKVLSHHTFGVLFCVSHKDEIVEALGLDGYHLLLSIIEQHHGEYGERPRTVAAYVIHKLDLLESVLTSINALLKDSPDGNIQYDNCKLS